MATYTDLYNLFSNSTLINRITVGVIVAAETVMEEEITTDNHANRLLWAASAFLAPAAEARRMYMAMLAANSGLSVATIESATDAAIQTNIDAHIDLFATGA